MKMFATLAAGACMTVALAGAAFAQGSSMSNMSATDKAMMTKCQGMSQSAMMANNDCTALMKKYPKGTTGSATRTDDNMKNNKNNTGK